MDDFKNISTSTLKIRHSVLRKKKDTLRDREALRALELELRRRGAAFQPALLEKKKKKG